jgi:hypothetical protein
VPDLADLARVSAELEQEPASSAIKWAWETFGEGAVLAASFQDCVLIDVATQVVPEMEVVFLDTQYHFAETLWYVEQVRERYKGLEPVQLADLRGLKGDTSDNIPGVKGIAEGGAITLLTQFGTVENLYDHLDDAPNRFKKALDGQRDIAAFSKDLATIRCDAPVTLDLRAAELHDYDRNAVISLFHELAYDLIAHEAPLTQVLSLPPRCQRRRSELGGGLMPLGDILRRAIASTHPDQERIQP